MTAGGVFDTINPLSEEEEHSASLTVVEHSKDKAEAKTMLQMLGLMEDPDEEAG